MTITNKRIFNHCSDFRQPVIFWFFFIKEKEQES